MLVFGGFEEFSSAVLRCRVAVSQAPPLNSSASRAMHQESHPFPVLPEERANLMGLEKKTEGGENNGIFQERVLAALAGPSR